MDAKRLIENLKKHGFSVSYFETSAEASVYLSSQINGETVGFGGSKTLEAMGLYEKLQEKNKVLWHWKNPADKEEFPSFTTYITSANGVAETGEIINIDGNGNRVASTLYGPKKLYFVIGTNKIAPDLHQAMDRARNIAAVKNAARLKTTTPCTVDGRCHDCNGPDRICRAMVITMRPMSPATHTEVVIINEDMGY